MAWACNHRQHALDEHDRDIGHAFIYACTLISYESRSSLSKIVYGSCRLYVLPRILLYHTLGCVLFRLQTGKSSCLQAVL